MVLSENTCGKTTRQQKPGSSPSLWDSPREKRENKRTNLVGLDGNGVNSQFSKYNRHKYTRSEHP